MSWIPPPPLFAPGDLALGRYRIESTIGEGGTATVWRALDEADATPVAVKVPSPAFLEANEERFRREIARAASLSHPAIVRMVATGEDRGVPIVVFEFMPGGTLQGWIAARSRGTPPRLAPGHLAGFVPRIVAALDHVDGLGLVHRDLKPANVLFDGRGAAYVTDFGISKAPGREKSLTPDGHFVGTPDYLAPEQFLDTEIDGRADQYALATIVFEATAGFPPFPRGSLGRLALMKTTEAAPSLARLAPDLPRALTAAVDRALSLARDGRFATSRAFLDAAGIG